MYLRKKMDSGKRLARGQTHRRGGWRRVISVALCAVLFSTNMVGVFAADLFDDTSCICDVLCGDEGNSACPVCAEDPAQCAAEAQPPQDEKPSVCICDALCGDEGNSACPVCAEDPAQCTAEAQPPEDEKTPVCICDILCGDEGNSACPVCAEDPAQCAAEVQPPEDEKPSVCICDALCGDEGNSACPVCAEDPAQCAAKAQPPEPEETYIIGWTWVDEEEFLTEYDGEWYLSLPGAERDDLTEELLEEMLPKKLCVELSDGETEYLPITWDFSPLSDNSQEYYRLDAAIGEDYALAKDVDAPYVLLEYGGAEVYDGKYPGVRRALTNTDSLADHTVKGITPAGTTVNLFDYDPKIGSNGNDVLPAGAKFEDYSDGINKDALLLFGGSAMREAGFWNLGSGAGRPWGQNNVNMKGIVKSTLEDNYPYINLDQARSTLQNPTKPIITEDDPWGDPNRKLMDIANLNHAEHVDAGVDEARALSVKLLESRGLEVADDGTVSGSCEKASLRYLFDPGTTTDGKKSYQNVTGLFQVDEDGYYYYDARKNFAEFEKSSATTKDGTQSDGSFTLYDGPAVWRTDAGWNESTQKFDGDMSLGNFFPFDSASKVFDSIQTEDKDGNVTNILSSSENITNVGNVVLANHYMGMTMQVDFTQPENGKLNMGSSGKQDMVFQFSGDDDVWVFIDDVLVLDLGGVHSELYGTINFSTGEVITGQSWRTGGLPDNPGSLSHDERTTLYDLFVDALGVDEADALHWVNNNGNMIFPTGTEHQLKMFYLERGNYDSSLEMRFNLQPSLYHSIKKVDQNGDPLEGVEFKLYAATANNGNSADAADYTVNGDVIGTLRTDKDGKSSFVRADGSPFSFTDRYHSDGTLYYILKETKTAGGYRALPKDIVLRFDPDTSMLVVANRYQTGAYASFFSNIRETGTITYGQFDEHSGDIASSKTELRAESKENGLIVAVPMLLESKMSHDDVAQNGEWLALYGSNTEGYGAVEPEERTAKAWRKAVLKAALYQASDERWPEWRLTYNQDTGRLEGLLEDLPGRADRYALNNPNGDMKMVYGVIEPSALKKLRITGTTSAELYDALEAYVSNAVETGVQSGKSSEEVIDEIIAQLNITGDSFDGRDFSFLNTDQFQREFRSTIYIPNERRELRVQKVDEDGKGVNGVKFTLTGPDGSIITGTTAKVDGQDGVLIFRPDALEHEPGYAPVKWAEVNSEYTLKETSAPEGYELNPTAIPVIVGIYSIYADAGTKDDGVTVMAGVGKLMQTMTKYAADDMVNITLRDITAIAQTQKAGSFALNGWADDLLAGTQIPRSMNLHYGVNAVVDYGLHDEDGGKIIYPFFTTNEGFLRARVVQNTVALQNKMYEGSSNTANWDDLSGRDLTSLFSLLNTVVVTDQKTAPEDTGKLRISKTVSGENLPNEDYTHNFTFEVSLKDAGGKALVGEYYYYGEQRAGYIRDGGTLSLRHDEALTVLGLPAGTQWKITEKAEDEWSISPVSGIISGEITKDETAYAAFTNYKGDLTSGSLTVSKTVAGNAGETDKEFHFTVTLGDTTVGGKYGGMTFTGGKATFTLKHNESKTATGLPAGITYTVAEDDYSDDGYVTTKTGDTGTIAKDGTSTAVFTNTKDVTPIDPDPDDSSLTVKKEWILDDGGKATDSVTVVLLRDGKEYEKVELSDRNNWTLTWTGLSDRYTWTVDEVNVPDGFTAKVDQNGMIFTITNDDKPTDPGDPTDPDKPTDDVPKTGDETNLTLWLVLLGISGMGTIITLLGSKRKYKGKHCKR